MSMEDSIITVYCLVADTIKDLPGDHLKKNGKSKVESPVAQMCKKLKDSKTTNRTGAVFV